MAYFPLDDGPALGEVRGGILERLCCIVQPLGGGGIGLMLGLDAGLFRRVPAPAFHFPASAEAGDDQHQADDQARVDHFAPFDSTDSVVLMRSTTTAIPIPTMSQP